MSEADFDVLVIGAGAAGLAAARTLEASGRSVAIVDGRSQPGGVIQTSEIDGYRVEHGPNTFLVKPPVHAFLRTHGLVALLEKASPASRKRQLLHAGQLVDVPLSPLSLVRTPLLSAAGKLRLLAEPFVARGDGGGESVAQFVARRLGSETVSALVGPFLTGVYAGDENRLGADAVFPALVELERAHGSLAVGGLVTALRSLSRSKKDVGSLPGTYTARAGLATLAGAMASGLAELRLDSPVLSLEPSAAGWRAEFASGALTAESVLLAVPAREAAALLAPFAPVAAASLSQIEYAPIAVVAFGADPSDLRTPADGFGFLVPREAGLGLLGCLFMSRLFAGRAPDGKVLLHCMVGGVRWPEAQSLDDADLEARVRKDLDRTLGLRGEPRRLMIQRWPRAVAQPAVGHRLRVAGIRRELQDRNPIELAGSHLDGVSLADTIASGVAAALRLTERANSR